MPKEEQTIFPHISSLENLRNIEDLRKLLLIERPKKRWYVYFLCDPDTEQPFYVGKGTGNRIDQHELEASDPNASNPAKQEIIRRILVQNKKVLKKKVAELDNEQDAYLLEERLIKHYGSQLANIRPGGGALQTEQRPEFLIPAEQETVLFHQKPIIVVHFVDGRTGVVLSSLCENLHLNSHGQCQRIKRNEAIMEHLVYAQIQTSGGTQIMPTLITRALPFWLATIDTRKMKKDDERRLQIHNYQRDAAEALALSIQSIAEQFTTNSSMN